MRSAIRIITSLTLAACVALPEMAAAMPTMKTAMPARPIVLVQSDGVVCDLEGCRVYGEQRYERRRSFETRRRQYVRPPSDEDDDSDNDQYYGNDQAPDVYVRPRVQRRTFVEPEPPQLPEYGERDEAFSTRHTSFCLNRYRSYNPRTNLYLARKNVFRRCVSPYN